MTGKDPARAAKWRGWLISVALHAAAAGLIALAARTATKPATGSTGFADNLAPGREISLVVLDDEPVRAGPKSIKPILVDTAPPLAAADPLPPLLPVPSTPQAAPFAPVPKAMPGPGVRPPVYNPPTPAVPAGPSGSPGGNGEPGRLPVSAVAKSVVFVLDRSASMGVDDRLAVARREILASLGRMPPGTRFQVVVYNRGSEILSLTGKREMVALSPATLAELAAALEDLTPEGGNDHLPALQQAMWMQPEVVCLLTDADDLTMDMVRAVREFNRGKCVIHAVTIGSAPRLAMQTLAAHNRGVCKAIEK
jgi:hypothetical protein